MAHYLNIEGFYIYPVKSTQKITLSETNVLNTGFKWDRYFGIVNNNNELLTAREKPELLQIKIDFNNENQIFSFKNSRCAICFSDEKEYTQTKISVFKKTENALVVPGKINNWLTTILNEPCQLVKINPNELRQNNQNTITLSDVAPIHLISKESLAALNQKLDTAIHQDRFRANIIVSGSEALDENNWKTVIIGNCKFNVISPTERCSLITIDPESGKKSTKQEPLRTLAKEFKSADKKVNFGIYLVPIKLGVINTNNKITVEYT